MILQNSDIEIEIDPANGSLTQLVDKRSDLNLIGDPRLGEAFVLVYGDESSQAHELSARGQEAPRMAEDGASVTLRWPGPLKGPAGEQDISVEMRIELSGSAVRCRPSVENHSGIVINEIRWMRVGGFNGYGDPASTRLVVPVAGSSAGRDLFHDFRTANGNSQELGTPAAENLFLYPGDLPMPWADLSNMALRRGVTFLGLDDAPRFRCLQLAVHPGIGHLRDVTWPVDDIPAEIPAGLTMGWVTFPYVKPGASSSGPVIVLDWHDDDWHEAGRRYRHWFSGQKLAPRPSTDPGIRSCGAVQDTMFLLPEGNVNLRFSQMRAWAAEAKRYGVEAVLASGWDLGGHDGMYPRYEPDPRLGSWDDLADGIAACHDEGVKIFFFVNLQAVDCGTEWYRDELHRYRTMDPWGSTQVMGWGMGTVAARIGATRRPIVSASPGFPEYRELIAKQFRRLASIGADGVHIDKLAWSHHVQLDFNPGLADPPDIAIWKGIMAFLSEVSESCRAVNPGFTISHEGAWDEVLAYSNVGWAWNSTWERDYEAIFKFVFPEWFPALSVTQPGDFNVVNSAVRYGFQMLLGPGNYTAGMAFPPMQPLARYVGEVNAIRSRLAGTLLRGRFEDQRGAVVTHGPDVRFSTHSGQDGEFACVIVNYGRRSESVRVERAGAGEVGVHEPFRPTRPVELPLELAIPPERFVIVTAERTGLQEGPDR